MDVGEPNLRRYSGNNPANQVDPSGLRGVPPPTEYRGGVWVPGRMSLRQAPHWYGVPRFVPPPGSPIDEDSWPKIREKALERCMEKVREELLIKLNEATRKKRGHSQKTSGKRGKEEKELTLEQLNGILSCVEAAKGKETGKLVKDCLSAACGFAEKSTFCKIWNILMWIDACALTAVLEIGNWIIGEDTMSRYWDDWSTIADCQTQSNIDSCKECCGHRFERGLLSDDGFLDCNSQCESKDPLVK